MKQKLYTFALALALSAPMVVLADVCDSINDIANGWNEMANAIHSMDLSQITDNDAAEIDAAIEEAYGATAEFADLFEAEGNDQEVNLGRNLNRALGVLWNAGNIDDVVYGMDGVVDSLDVITDYCDQQ